ncbi:MAG TPA: Gmad2 immunoglobulin-like domain-containing protein, partial [Roseiflexaceae bacterium]|nr:Gmad2 immunoglobulin-like domain-containing protein [Roseiflexaceae bacterium]
QGASPGAPQPPPSNAGQQIFIDFPTPGTAISQQFLFRGRTTRYPFEGELHWKVLDENGFELASDVFRVDGAVGGPTSWQVVVGRPWVGTGRRLTVLIYDFDGAVTGQIVALASVNLVANDG